MNAGTEYQALDATYIECHENQNGIHANNAILYIVKIAKKSNEK